MKIAICITTRNRITRLYESSLFQHMFLPPNARMFIVDDASEAPIQYREADYLETYRFVDQVGVPKAKNKCLRLAYDWGADHIFLFDDDTYPIKKDWWVPYVQHKEPHLMYQFRLPSKSKTDMRELYRDDTVVAYSHTRGCMLYVDRKVLNIVGGMDTAYGLGMYEHTDWTNRIHNAGLTTHRAMDVPNSNKLIYCADQEGWVVSSISDNIKRKNMVQNYKYYKQSKTSKAFKEF